MQGTIGVLSACLLTAAMLGNVFAQEPESSPPTATESEEQPTAQIAEEVRQKLHEPVTIDLKDVPIREAIELLLGHHKIDFWFDERAIKEIETSLDDVEITCNLHNVSVRSALKRVLTQAQLSWICEDAGVRITSETTSANTTFARIYEIAELLEEPIVEVVPPRSPINTTQYGGGLGGVAPAPLSAEDKAHAEFIAKEAARPEKVLIRTIQESTGGVPNAPWMESDGEGGSIHLIKTANTKLLVIRQTEQAHGEIEDLLNDLLSHHHHFDEEESGPATPKTAVRIRTRSPVKVVAKRQAAAKPTPEK